MYASCSHFVVVLVVELVCGSDAYKERCADLASRYATEEFIKTYCAFCIKALYARRFKVVKYSLVNTL